MQTIVLTRHSLHVVNGNALVVKDHALLRVVVRQEELCAHVTEEDRDGNEISGRPEVVVGAVCVRV